MSKIPFFIFLIFLFSCSNEKQNVENLIIKNKIAFKPDSDEPYTGQIFRLNNKGKKAFEGYLKDGVKNGEFIFYDENESIKMKENYKMGEKDGEFISFFENGSLRDKKYYNDGLENGKFEIFNIEGNKIYEGTYNDGLQEGRHKYWFPNGKQVQVEYEYSKGTILIGTVIEYYENGKVKTKFERLAKNNYKMIEYYPNSNIKHELKFLYESYEDLINKRFFHVNVRSTAVNNEDVAMSEVEFDLGNGWNEFTGIELFYNESGNVTRDTYFFYPSSGSVIIYHRDGNNSNYDVSNFTNYYDERGVVIKKCAKSSGGGELGCYEGENLDKIVLMDIAGD